MKRLLLFAALLQAWALAAQCPDCTSNCDPRLIYLELKVVPPGVSGPIKASLCKTHSLHNVVLFQLIPTSLVDPPGTLWCDPGDGAPAFLLVEGSPVAHTFPLSSGGVDITYDLSFQIRDGNNAIVMSLPAPLVIKATYSVGNAGYTVPDDVWIISTTTTFSPPVSGAFPAGSPYNSNAVGTADAYIRYAPGHNGKLLQPLIFVDGFDVDPSAYSIGGVTMRHGSSGWDVFMLGNDNSAPNPYDLDPSVYRHYPAALAAFSQAGYDIVFIDFADGSDYIQKNGLLLVKLIQQINERKALYAEQGETVCDNAVIGASMGGQIAKWALSYMEEQGIPHQTHTYVSFDSPQRGAHIPLGIQSFAYLANLADLDENDFWGKINSPAARQMLITTLGSSWEGGLSGLGDLGIQIDQFDACFLDPYQGTIPVTFGYGNSLALRQSFQNEIASLAYPQTTRNVAISCGSRSGTKLPFADGALYFQAHRYFDLNGFQDLLGCNATGDVVKINMAALNSGASLAIDNMVGVCVNEGLGAGCFTANIPAEADCVFRGFMPNIFEEEAPRGIALLTVRDAGMLPALDNAPGCRRGDLLGLQADLEKQGMAVTINLRYTSFMPTLSLLDINLPMDNTGLLTSFPTNEAVVASGLTPFQAVWASPDVNFRHVELTPAMTTWTLQQLAIGLAEAGNAALNLTTGQTFNYGKRKNRVPDVTINNGAKLAVNIAGKINYMTPADPTADLSHFEVYTGGGCSLGKTVTVENGGFLQIGDPGSAKTGVFHALRGSVVHVKNGGVLRIDNPSALIIYPGATLILDPGAIVHLESTDAKIRIEGKLLVNGDITFSGPGHFEFAPGNILEYGTGYQTFHLVGAGQQQRFIRILDDAQLRVPAYRNIDLRNGKVQCEGETYLSEGSGGSFTQVFFEGAGNGVRGELSGSLHVQNCRFEGCSYGIELLGGSSTARVENSQFVGYTKNGIHLQNRYNLELLTSTLESDIAWDAVYAQDVFVVIHRECLVTAAQTGTYNGNSSNYDPLILAPASTGVRLEGGWVYWMDGGEIQNADVGIANLDGGPTNVLMSNFATVRDCHAGIAMRGNAGTGLVAMKCARLINNLYGVYGRDVTLLIDPALLNGQSTQNPPSNTFIRRTGGGQDNSEYFHICYGLKTPPNPIPATQNYWGSTTGVTVYTDANPAAHAFLCFNAAATGGCSTNAAGCTMIGLNTVPSVGRQPTGCPVPGLFCTDPDGDCTEACTVAVSGGESTSVRGQFLAAMQYLENENFATAKGGFEPVAALWGTGSLGYTPVCRTYVDAARSLTDAEGFAGGEGEERGEPNSSLGLVQLAPNPAASEVTVLLSAEITAACRLRVWNVRGELVLIAPVTESSHRLQVSQWPSGLYIVEISALDGSFDEKIKFAVQH